MRLTEIRRDVAFAAGLGIVGLALWVRSNRIMDLWPEPLGPKLYPMIVSGGLAVAALWALFDAYRRHRSKKGDAAKTEADLASTGEAHPSEATGTWKRPVTMGLLCVLYLAGQKILGFYVSTALFLLTTMVALTRFASDRVTWRGIVRSYVPLAAGLVIALYAVAQVLSMYIPEGGVLF